MTDTEALVALNLIVIGQPEPGDAVPALGDIRAHEDERLSISRASARDEGHA